MIDEYVGAIARFADDLYAVGVPRPHLGKAIALYSIALHEPSREAWACLYRHVSQLLQQRLRKPLKTEAARRLYAFLDDDLGRIVLELPVRTRLHELLLQDRIAS